MAVWLSGKDRLPCNVCRATWLRYNQQPPCDTCYPGIHEYNKNLYRLYNIVGDQFIMGPTGPVALSLSAIMTGLKIIGIDPIDHEAAITKIKYFTSLICDKKRD